MSTLEVILVIAGFGVTALVGVGMILITPLGVVELDAEEPGADGSNLAAVPASAGHDAPVPS